MSYEPWGDDDQGDCGFSEDRVGEIGTACFRRGAQICREMMARFVEQGGNATTAASIRANWNPAWGDDPGRPDDAMYAQDQRGFDPFECA
ncbi:MAG: hypothetical protein M0Z28_21030 [Rhodospirillales bacterium]|nr:hypothetical protein [Rhodospirillales bacterium]